jgi:hypothetical protein
MAAMLPVKEEGPREEDKGMSLMTLECNTYPSFF